MAHNLPIPSSPFTVNPLGAFDSVSNTFGSNESNNTNEAVAQNIIFEGTILDKDSKPIPGVSVTFTQTPKPNLPPDQLISPLTKTLTTNTQGEWSITYPKSSINLKSVDIVFSKPEYKTETIKNPRILKIYPVSESPVEKISTSENEPPYEYKVGNEIFKNANQAEAKKAADEYQARISDPKYKGASIVKIKKKLTKSPQIKEALQSLIQPILDEISEAEVTQSDKLNSAKVFPLVRLSYLISIGKEKAKEQLIPFILKLLMPFGLPVVQAIVNKIPIDKIKNQILCPKIDNLSGLIKKRNKITKQINSLYKTISTMSKVFIGIETAMIALKIGIKAIGIIPFPMPPAVPVVAGVLEELLKRFGVVVNVATLALTAFATVLGIILGLLSALDLLLQTCLQSQNEAIAQGGNNNNQGGNNNNQGGNNNGGGGNAGQVAIQTFEKINDELNLFINESTGIDNKTIINNKQTYKGFILELVMDPYNSLQYPKRYAQALTQTKVPVLKTDSSFASDPQILIDQLKFLIDSNPDLTSG
jgi:hypothetical protein